MSVIRDGARLETLPNEILHRICFFVLGDESELCLNVRIGMDSVGRLQHEHSDAISGLRVLLKTNHLLRAHALKWLDNPRRHTYARTESFSYFGRTFGRCSARLLKRLDLKLSHKQKFEPESEWPDLLKMLVSDLPGLESLKLRACWLTTAPPHFPADVSEDPWNPPSRKEQEMRALLRSSAFIALRHPILQRIILPSDSEVSSNEGDLCSRRHLILDQGNMPTEVSLSELQ